MSKITKLMGILNVTPDSFYERSRAYSSLSAIKRGILLATEGADIIDIGGSSSRPGSIPLPENEELRRVIPVISALRHELKTPLSIDTHNPRVAEQALKVGCQYINDISGFEDPDMRALAVSFAKPIIVMHMQGSTKTMQQNPVYKEGVVNHLLAWFEKRVELLLKEGVTKNHIILDPGIGFGKSLQHNLEIIRNLSKIKALGFPVLLGLSRKSFMGKILNKEAEELLSATLTLNTLAIQQKVDIIRVHDVKEHRDLIDICHAIHA